MKAKTAIITSVSAIMCGLFVLSACNNQPKYSWGLSDLGESVSCHTAAQTEYLEGDYKEISADGKQELSRPEPIRLTWSATPEKDYGVSVDYYVVELSTDSSFNTSKGYGVYTNELELYNLYLATDYYWRVSAMLSDGSTSNVSKTASFTTSDVAPRNIYIDGVTNMRDLGGWKTADGGRVKQGMIYRCGRLNESETNGTVNIEITENGISAMRGLGIKSQIDLRTPDNHSVETGGLTSSPLGENVNYYNCAMEWDVGSKNILTYEKNIPQIKAVFGYLADESNYPVIYHCNIGTDRTGLFAFLLNGLMGVAEEDLYRDYLFSNFGYICTKTTDSPRSYAKLTAAGGYVDIIKKYNGATLSEKIENYLVEKVGIPKSDLDAIREILAD